MAPSAKRKRGSSSEVVVASSSSSRFEFGGSRSGGGGGGGGGGNGSRRHQRRRKRVVSGSNKNRTNHRITMPAAAEVPIRSTLITATLHLGRVHGERAVVKQQVRYLHSLLRFTTVERCRQAAAGIRSRMLLCCSSDNKNFDDVERNVKLVARFCKEMVHYMKIYPSDKQVVSACLTALTELSTLRSDNHTEGGRDAAVPCSSIVTTPIKMCIVNCALEATVEAIRPVDCESEVRCLAMKLIASLEIPAEEQQQQQQQHRNSSTSWNSIWTERFCCAGGVTVVMRSLLPDNMTNLSACLDVLRLLSRHQNRQPELLQQVLEGMNRIAVQMQRNIHQMQRDIDALERDMLHRDRVIREMERRLADAEAEDDDEEEENEVEETFEAAEA